MKTLRSLLTTILLTLIIAGFASAQAIDKITRRCPAPNSSQYATILVQGNGDITYTPCPGRASIFNGIVNLSGAIVNLGLTDTYIPVANITGGLVDSGLSFSGDDYFFDNLAGNASWNFSVRVSNDSLSGNAVLGSNTGSGTRLELVQNTNVVQVGGLEFRLFDTTQPSRANFNTTTGVYEMRDQSGGQFFRTNLASGELTEIHTTQTLIGRPAVGANFYIDNGGAYFGHPAAATGSGMFGIDVANLAIFKTIAGTTGDQTIARPAGRVTFNTTDVALVVTNASVTSNSIVLITETRLDATCTRFAAEPNSGFFTLTTNAACTAITGVSFLVIN
jgi:hypothetical protein